MSQDHRPLPSGLYYQVITVTLLSWTLLAASCSAAPGEAGVIREVRHEPAQPVSGTKVRVTAHIPSPVRNVVLQIQVVEPGQYVALADREYASRWQTLPMTDGGTQGDVTAGDGTFTAEIPEANQRHRRLVRYRVQAQTATGKSSAPALDDPQPNFAYFVYDGIPAWRGALNPRSGPPEVFGAEVMRSVQAYHLLSKHSWVENATWREQSRTKDYKYTGTFVHEGKVYDHVRFRARGGDWRHAMGKNMWKVDFHKGHFFGAKDDYGRTYSVPWGKLNLRACIQQGDYGQRGEQGLFEAVGFKLFNLAGVEAPRTHWVQLRIVSEADEAPPDQYRGDFWGLYLAIENEDGQFLKEHGLPDGNLFKMMWGTGELSNQGKGQAADGSDLRAFMSAYQGRDQSEDWWRKNLDLPRYYSYRSIVEAIHHYDIAAGKNYDYYLNPETKRWAVVPWDIDLTWADHMYGNGDEPFRRRVLSKPAFMLEYQNRLREIRDLLYNPDQTGSLIDEYAALISNPGANSAIVDADRAKWDYHPIMVSKYVIHEKAGHGLFYRAARTRNFAGMVQLMKDYVVRRSAFIDRTLLNDSTIPARPEIKAGASDRPRTFQCSDFKGQSPFAAMQWRVAEIAGTRVNAEGRREPGIYEITPVWESGEQPEFQRDISLPPATVKIGKTYRVRARLKDRSGRWSHWSEPVQFTAK
jgi:hypothetical protein